MHADEHVDVVRRYFHDILDGQRFELVDDLVTPDVVLHRPGLTLRGRGDAERMARAGARMYESCVTTLHDVFAGDRDRVTARLTHTVRYRGEEINRLGRFDVGSASSSWEAIAVFRFEGARIAELWVSRDELGLLIDLGVLSPGSVER